MIEKLPKRAQAVPCARREVDNTLEGGTMIIRLLHLLEHLTGALLSGVGMGVLVGNVLACTFLVVLGPTFVIELFAK